VTVEKLISPLIQEQFPEFYKSEGENFIAFTKAYFEWLEQSNNMLDHARSLQDYRDVDSTPDDFILHFKEKYLRNIEFETTTNKRLLIKNSLDIYRSKGSDRSIDLLFKLLYGTGAEVYTPSVDIFKLSDGEWVRPTYIEISDSSLTVGLVGKQIEGVTSGATAFVEKYIKRRVKDAYVHILYITNIVGDFEKRELLSSGTINSDLPYVLGSLSEIEVIDGSAGFNVGDVVTVKSASGDYGQARVVSTSDVAGVVDFEFVDGGYGYTATPNIHISNTVLALSNVSANTSDTYAQFELVVQPITDITYSSLAGTFVEGQNVFSTTGTGVGRVLAINATASSMKLSRESGDFTASGKIYITGNTANATIATSTNNDIGGYVTKVPTVVELVMSSNTGFTEQQEVYQVVSGNETANGVITKITSKVLKLANLVGTFVTTDPLLIRNSSNTGTVESISMQIALHTTNGAFLSDFNPIVYGSNSGPTGRVDTVSSGTDASFDILGIEDEETVYFNTDLLSGNNISSATYMSIALNAATYGFPDNPSANISGNLWYTFAYTPLEIGTISGITNINPGIGYSTEPSVTIEEADVAVYDRRDYKFYIDTATGNFRAGEKITQTTSLPAYDLTVAANTGYIFGEHVTTPSGNGDIASITGLIIRVENVLGTFSNGQTLTASVSGQTTSITTATSNPTSRIASGEVVSGNTAVLHVKRQQFQNWFIVGGNAVIGSETGAQANLASLDTWANSEPIGLNAVISTDVVSSDGSVDSLAVLDTGYGYANGSLVSFVLATGETGTGTVITGATGRSGGYFKSTKGFLSADKYLFDGDYYQFYSYEVISRLPFDRYSEMLKKVLHVAGTKAFGSVLVESVVDVSSPLIESEIEQETEVVNWEPFLRMTFGSGLWTPDEDTVAGDSAIPAPWSAYLSVVAVNPLEPTIARDVVHYVGTEVTQNGGHTYGYPTTDYIGLDSTWQAENILKSEVVGNVVTFYRASDVIVVPNFAPDGADETSYSDAYLEIWAQPTGIWDPGFGDGITDEVIPEIWSVEVYLGGNWVPQDPDGVDTGADRRSTFATSYTTVAEWTQRFDLLWDGSGGSPEDFGASATDNNMTLDFKNNTYTIAGAAKSFSEVVEDGPGYVFDSSYLADGEGLKVTTSVGEGYVDTAAYLTAEAHAFATALKAANGGLTVVVTVNMQCTGDLGTVINGQSFFGIELINNAVDAGWYVDPSWSEDEGDGLSGFGDFGTTFEPMTLPGNGKHILAINFTDDDLVVSVDGGTNQAIGHALEAFSWDLTRIYFEAAGDVADTDSSTIIEKVQFMPLVDDADLPSLSSGTGLGDDGHFTSIRFIGAGDAYRINNHQLDITEVIEPGTALGPLPFDYSDIDGLGLDMDADLGEEFESEPFLTSAAFAAVTQEGTEFTAIMTGTIYMDAVSADGAAQIYCEFHNADSSKRWGVQLGWQNNANDSHISDSTGSLAEITGITPATNITPLSYKIAMNIQASGISVSVNGGSVITSTAPEAMTMAKIFIGAYAIVNVGTNNAKAIVKSVDFYRLADDADLPGLSA
jgi:hypothetical protein